MNDFLVVLSKKVRLRIQKFTYSTPVPEEILDTIGDSQHEGDDRKIEYALLLLFHWQMHPCLVSKLKWEKILTRETSMKREQDILFLAYGNLKETSNCNSKPIFQQKNQCN